jgi:prepilin-type N-terminal cleavage/methylation domain-containing protein
MTPNRPGRRGFTLAEMLTVIGALGVALLLCAGLTRALLRLDRAGRDRLAEGTSLGRLARDFRADAHAATAAATRPEPGDGPNPRAPRPESRRPLRLDLTRPDGRTVEYRVRDGALVRTVRDRGDVDGEERYRLPGRTTARLDARDEGGRTMASIAFDLAPGESGESLLQGLRVEAVVGLGRASPGKDAQE